MVVFIVVGIVEIVLDETVEFCSALNLLVVESITFGPHQLLFRHVIAVQEVVDVLGAEHALDAIGVPFSRLRLVGLESLGKGRFLCLSALDYTAEVEFLRGEVGVPYGIGFQVAVGAALESVVVLSCLTLLPLAKGSAFNELVVFFEGS